MVYTVDGSAPTTNSPVYTSPIAPAIDRGVTVQAACLLPNGQLGIVASRILRRSDADRLESGQRGQRGNRRGGQRRRQRD